MYVSSNRNGRTVEVTFYGVTHGTPTAKSLSHQGVVGWWHLKTVLSTIRGKCRDKQLANTQHQLIHLWTGGRQLEASKFTRKRKKWIYTITKYPFKFHYPMIPRSRLAGFLWCPLGTVKICCFERWPVTSDQLRHILTSTGWFSNVNGVTNYKLHI